MGKAAKRRQARLSTPNWKKTDSSQSQATRQRKAAALVQRAKRSAAHLRQNGFDNPFVFVVENEPLEVADTAKQILQDEGNELNISIVHGSEFDALLMSRQ